MEKAVVKIAVDSDLKKRVKLFAMEKNMTMTEIIEDSLKEYFEEHEDILDSINKYLAK